MVVAGAGSRPPVDNPESIECGRCGSSARTRARFGANGAPWRQASGSMAADAAVVRRGRRPTPHRAPPHPFPSTWLLQSHPASARSRLILMYIIVASLTITTPAFYGDADIMNVIRMNKVRLKKGTITFNLFRLKSFKMMHKCRYL